MNESAPTSSMLVGDIRPSDYLAVSRRFILSPPWMRFAGPLIGIGGFAIIALGIQLLCPEDERHLVRIVVCPIVTAVMAFLFVCFKVLTRAARSFYKNHAIVPNMGSGTYTIIGSDLHFSGTMWDCTMPISGIKEIAMFEGVTLLILSNATCFLIPRVITSGDLSEFLAQLRARRPA